MKTKFKEEVIDYIVRKDLEKEFKNVLNKIEKLFKPDKITISIVYDPYTYEDGSERIVFDVKSNLSKKDFDTTLKSLYKTIRNSRIYHLIVISSDL